MLSFVWTLPEICHTSSYLEDHWIILPKTSQQTAKAQLVNQNFHLLLSKTWKSLCLALSGLKAVCIAFSKSVKEARAISFRLFTLILLLMLKAGLLFILNQIIIVIATINGLLHVMIQVFRVLRICQTVLWESTQQQRWQSNSTT